MENVEGKATRDELLNSNLEVFKSINNHSHFSFSEVLNSNLEVFKYNIFTYKYTFLNMLNSNLEVFKYLYIEN